MSNRNDARVRRAKATRAKIAELKAVRLTVHRSNTHIYAQVIDPTGSKVL
ncbi:MAG: 50S ribosomal protein L18, partial [Burkholderiales bacterium]